MRFSKSSVTNQRNGVPSIMSDNKKASDQHRWHLLLATPPHAVDERHGASRIEFTCGYPKWSLQWIAEGDHTAMLKSGQKSKKAARGESRRPIAWRLMERETGFEPAALGLGSQCSTN